MKHGHQQEFHLLQESIMSEPFTALVLKAAVVKAVEVMMQNIVNIKWNKEFDDAKEIVRELESEQQRNNYLRKHVQHILKMRTLINPNDDVTLDDVYYPLTLITASNGDRVVIKDKQTLDFSGVINIIGIAGQGKSTVLRKLFLEEIKKGERIPFFIELRNVEDGDIIFYFKNILKSLNVNVTDSNVEYLLQTGKVLLLLDGFDEVRQEIITKTLSSIIQLNKNYACPVIVSSRPNTEICMATGCYNMRVENIDLIDKVSILNLIEQRDINSNGSTFRLLSDLLMSRASFADMICNPIMVTLLYHCFPYMDEVPKDISEFYRQLFGVLYARHDKTKGYNNRQRESGVDVEPAREFFSYLCLKSLLKEEYELDSFRLHQYVTVALNTSGYDSDKASLFINDLVKITCLLQADGNDRFVFLHKTVQEFFAAFYLSIMKDGQIKEKIYASLRGRVQKSEVFDNFLNFLFHLDRKSFISEMTLKAFDESGLKDFAEMSYDEFSVPFDKLLKEGNLRGESHRDETIITLVAFSSPARLINIGFLNVINGEGRTQPGDIDQEYLNEANKGINKDDLSGLKYSVIEPEKSGYSDHLDNDSDDQIVTYVFSLIEYLKRTGLYEHYKQQCFRSLDSYNRQVYKVRLEEFSKMTNAMNNGFDFL